jgi:hypothetical protein
LFIDIESFLPHTIRENNAMTWKRELRGFLTISAILSAIAAAPSGAAEKIMLDRAAIVIDFDRPSFVQYGVEDLAGYLEELTGNKVPVMAAADGGKGVNIVVGPKMAAQIVPQALPRETLGDEAYVLRAASKDGAEYILAAGGTPRGTKIAMAALMKRIRVAGKSAFVAAPLDVRGKPSFAKRGMHFNGWAFNAPYSFRNWREKDWQRYLDILSYQGINLFYLWPFIEIMPVPLSKEDRAYLEECRRVVDYAQKKHGMEVWVMQCTNRVAKDRCGVADPRLRPYWRPSQEDLNPGDPQAYRAIMESREAMYRILDNADGVCNIDSDPGAYDGSPLSDYLKVLKGCRELLDQHNIHGKETKLINWMWTGWGLPAGRFFDRKHQLLAIRGLRETLPEPWGLVSGQFQFLPICREEKVLAKTVMLPYGVIEGEPSYPATNVAIEGIRRAFDGEIIKYPELAGVMGNVQTPLLQFPHVFYFTSALGDLDYRKRSEKETLRDLSEYLYPERKELIADCYLALKEKDSAKVAAIASQLDALIGQDMLGRPGLFGRKLFPDSRIVAQTLAMQLNFRAARQRLVAIGSKSPDKVSCVKLLQDYFDAYLAWDTAHGWHALWGWNEWILGNGLDGGLQAAAREMGRILGSEAAVERCFAQIEKALTVKYGETPVKIGCIAPLKPLVRAGLPNLAQKAKASASQTPDPMKYPPSAAIDGNLSTLYWPGALVKNNSEWFQLTWDAPQTIDRIIVRFLQHPSMRGRTIHLQKEVAPNKWEDIATAVVSKDRSAPQAAATFQLPAPITLDKIRVVNLLDLFEIEVR